jgi:rubredoxin
VITQEKRMKKWQCAVCGFVYDEAAGLPAEGVAPGTPWAAIPADWSCADCGASKSDFQMVELAA